MAAAVQGVLQVIMGSVPELWMRQAEWRCTPLLLNTFKVRNIYNTRFFFFSKSHYLTETGACSHNSISKSISLPWFLLFLSDTFHIPLKGLKVISRDFLLLFRYVKILSFSSVLARQHFSLTFSNKTVITVITGDITDFFYKNSAWRRYSARKNT